MASPGTKIWEHTIETVLLLEVVTLAAISVQHRAGWPGWPIPTVAAVSGLIAAFLAWCLTGSARFSWSLLSYGACLGAWALWAELTSLWSAVTIVTWLLSSSAFIPMIALTAAHGRDIPKDPPAEAKPDPEAEKAEQIGKFQKMFIELGLSAVQVTDMKTELSGRVLRLELPRSGKITIDNLAEKSPAISVILRLKKGLVEFEEGDHSADVIMRLRERNFLANTVELRPEHRARTINKAFAIGQQEDGSIATITLRGLHAQIIGMTGAGKSNLLNVILAQLCGMNDTVVWVIDMKGGRFAKPWLAPYLEGKAGTPAIDWVATTREEAAIMMQAFVKAIDARMNSGIGGSKIVPSPSMPQIILLCDEMADLFGQMKGTRRELGEGATTNAEFIRMGETLVQKGRSEAGTTIWATQRGTNSMAGSGDLKSQCALQIMLGTRSRTEASYVNSDNQVAQARSTAMIGTPGGGVVTMGKKSSLPTKFFLHDHPAKPGSETGETLCDNGCIPSCPVYRTALETSSVRPGLDLVTAGAMGEDYSARWQRAEAVLKRPVPAGRARPAASTVDVSSFDDIMRGSGMSDPEAKIPPGQRRVLEILTARGAMGATPNFLLSSLQKEDPDGAPVRETLQRWLTNLAGQGLIHNPDFGRWKIGPSNKPS